MTDTGETMGLREAVARIVGAGLVRAECTSDPSRMIEDDAADAILALPQLAAQQAGIAELEAALAPFAKVAEHYGGHDDADLVVVDLGQCRTARAALRKDPQQSTPAGLPMRGRG